MTNEQHFRRLESMYAASPINKFFSPTLVVEEGFATVEIDVEEKFFHSADAVHGSVYIKLLDDAAWFAANSLETEFFVLTTSFTSYLTRPISTGKMRATGEVVNLNGSQFIAEAIVFDEDEDEIGRATGIFVRSKLKLEDTRGYGK